MFIRGLHYILYRHTQKIVPKPVRDAAGDTDTEPYFCQRQIILPRRVTAIKPHVFHFYIYIYTQNGDNVTQRRVN